MYVIKRKEKGESKISLVLICLLIFIRQNKSVTKYPYKFKKKKSKELHTAVCIVENINDENGERKYLLFQRPNTGRNIYHH